MNIKELQPDVISLINNSFDNNRISHAYIFEGEKGTGTKDVAIYFAKKILCYNKKACDSCENCIRINNNTHTNVIYIDPIQQVIRKDQINALIHEGNMSSITDNSRVFIINQAEKMNRSSSNTLLKFLEEPTTNNYLILLTENANMLLETILSRAILVHFKPVNKQQLISFFENEGIEANMSYILSEVFGNLDDALTKLKEGIIINAFDFFKKILNAMHTKKDLYVEYLLNKKLLSDNYANIYFLQMLLLFKKNELTKNSIFFKEYQNHNLDKDTIIKQIEIINECIDKINAKISVDAIYVNLFNKL